MPQRYDISTDEMVEVTQEWIDDIQKAMNRFGAAREAARTAICDGAGNERTLPALQAFLDAWKPEFKGKGTTDA